MKKTLVAEPGDVFIRGIQGYLNRLEEIAEKAVRHPEPGLEFDRLGARDLLFRLEAAGRFIAYCLESKKAEAFLKPIKSAEDFLGVYDHAEEIYFQMKKVKELPARFKKYFQSRHIESQKELSVFLQDSGWLASEGKYDELRRYLSKLKMPDSFDLPTKYREFLKQECKELHDHYRKGKVDFYAMEDGLHEFRRDLRWISLYAQISEGMCRLRAMRVIPEAFKPFVHTTYVQSPYNRLPEGPFSEQALLFQAPVFYALSYLIDALGKLKDEGLMIHAVYDAIQASALQEREAKALCRKLKIKPERLTELSEEAEIICDKLMIDLQLMPRLIRDTQRITA